MALPGPDYDPDAPAAGGDGLFGLPHAPDEAAVVVIPVPFEATASSGKGTAGAPEAVRVASHQVDLHDPLTPDTWRKGVAMAPVPGDIEAWNEEACRLALPILEAGGADGHAFAQARVNELGKLVNTAVHDETKRRLLARQIPAVLGGDHSVAFGAIKAAAEMNPGMGVLHIDAHADLREAYMGFTWSHASLMYNVVNRVPHLGHLVQVGIRDFGRAEAERIEQSGKITAFTDHELAWELGSGENWMRIAARIVRALPPKVWVSFDVDGLDPSLCPNTGTPVPGGLSWRHTKLLLQLLGQRHQIVGFDVCEVGTGPMDANVGARVLYQLAGWATHPPTEG